MNTFFTRRTSLTLAALAALTLAGTAAHAQTSIYVYNFNDASSTNDGSNATDANTAALFSVDTNNGRGTKGSALSTTFTPTSAATAAASGVASFTGTTVNANGADGAGAALALSGGGTGSGATYASANNGMYLQATADLTGFQNVGFSFASQRTGTGFNSDQFQYSLNGMSFINFGAAYTPASSFAAAGTGVVESFDLSGIAGLNNDPNAAFRIVFNGATSTAGNNRLDNLIISGTPAGGTPAVPEASTTVSLGLLLALGLGGLVIAKKRTARA